MLSGSVWLAWADKLACSALQRYLRSAALTAMAMLGCSDIDGYVMGIER